MGLPYGKLLTAEAYAEEYGAGADFESVCIDARQQNNAAFLVSERPETVLEVGCGPILLIDQPGVADVAFRRWIIAEPAERYAAAARLATAADGRFEIVENYLEACITELRHAVPEGYAAAIVSGVVHETTNPLGLLVNVVGLLRSGGKLLVSVPNALSFHRLLAVHCGLIESAHQLSAIDKLLGHPTVFDHKSLSELVTRAGAVCVRAGGSLFKPFTNAQMHSLVGTVGMHLIPGLIELGRWFPENAAEIYVIARKP